MLLDGDCNDRVHSLLLLAKYPTYGKEKPRETALRIIYSPWFCYVVGHIRPMWAERRSCWSGHLEKKAWKIVARHENWSLLFSSDHWVRAWDIFNPYVFSSCLQIVNHSCIIYTLWDSILFTRRGYIWMNDMSSASVLLEGIARNDALCYVETANVLLWRKFEAKHCSVVVDNMIVIL